jgi:hypothetical protein
MDSDRATGWKAKLMIAAQAAGIVGALVAIGNWITDLLG